MRVGIVGGGPGGLITAYLLQRRSSSDLDIKIFEASDRFGGKVLTGRFDSAPVPYEAGTAELYGYAHIKSDPLYNLVKDLGLCTKAMTGRTVILSRKILNSPRQISKHLGTDALRAIHDFHSDARRRVTPIEYYNSGWPDDNKHPCARKSFQSLIAKVPSGRARRYLKVAVHSDLATEPPRTNALYGLHNVLMEHEDYVRLYTIDGGMERLTQALTTQVSAHLAKRSRVIAIKKSKHSKYVIHYEAFGSVLSEKFDVVVVAVPNCWIPTIEWRGRRLERRMCNHNVYYDGPAHYLRICILFKQPFWREAVDGSFFQLDAFGGCCVYDEGTRLDVGPYGVLNLLLSGTGALLNGNSRDAELIEQAIDSLPEQLGPGRELFLEGKVHRWLGTISAPRVDFHIDGPRARHRPDSKKHPGLFVVGDYLFDDTINGLLDSADIASRMVLRHLGLRRRPFTLDSRSGKPETPETNLSGGPPSSPTAAQAQR